VNAFAVKGFAEPVAVYRIEQTHRTRVIADQYIVVTDLKGFTPLFDTAGTATVETILDGLLNVITDVCHEFGGVVRFSAGDAYCLTFTNAERAMAGLEDLVATWGAFTRKADVPCRINIAVHKGTLYAFRSYLHGRDLNLTFHVEGATARRLVDDDNICITEAVRQDLAGTGWERRLEPVNLEPTPARLADIGIYQLRSEVGETRR
jgi:class 3 adenylate cyclase